MPWSLLKLSEQRRLRWKNGRGETRELAISPPGASFATDPFLWRLSSARVAEEGPFSRFPGYDRWLALSEGAELGLRLGTRRLRVTPEAAIRFSGDDEVEARLPAGPVTDLGLIFDRARVEAGFGVGKLEPGGKARALSLAGREVLLVALSGRLEVITAQQRYQLEAGEALFGHPEGSEGKEGRDGWPAQLSAEPDGARYAWVELTPTPCPSRRRS